MALRLSQSVMGRPESGASLKSGRFPPGRASLALVKSETCAEVSSMVCRRRAISGFSSCQLMERGLFQDWPKFETDALS
jgi:hypothetical protein